MNREHVMKMRYLTHKIRTFWVRRGRYEFGVMPWTTGIVWKKKKTLYMGLVYLTIFP